MRDLASKLMAELECETAFTIPVFGGIPIPESVVVTWVIMIFLVLGSIFLTRNLKVVPESKRQIIAETIVEFFQNFFGGILGNEGKIYLKK